AHADVRRRRRAAAVRERVPGWRGHPLPRRPRHAGLRRRRADDPAGGGRRVVRIDELLRAGGGPVFSFEFGPPRTPEAELALWQAVEELRALDPAFVSVTWGAGGSTRGPTLETVRRMHQVHGLEAMPHLTCVGSTAAELRALVRGIAADGIDNLLVLRGE